MNDAQRIEVQKVLKGVIGLQGTPLLTYAMQRSDGKWDVADRNATVTIADKPPAGKSTQVLIFEA